MSFFGIGRGRNQVPNAQSAQNQKIIKDNTASSVIKSAAWAQDRAGLNDAVPFVVTLLRAPFAKKAAIEVFYHGPGAKPHPFDTPILVEVTSLKVVGTWSAKAPRMREYAKGFFTFKVTIDNEMKTSGQLQLTDDPVARVVRRNNTDGFDR